MKSFQISTLTNILSTGPAAENQNSPDLQQFRSWKGKAAAQILLPAVEIEASKEIKRRNKVKSEADHHISPINMTKNQLNVAFVEY